MWLGGACLTAHRLLTTQKLPQPAKAAQLTSQEQGSKAITMNDEKMEKSEALEAILRCYDLAKLAAKVTVRASDVKDIKVKATQDMLAIIEAMIAAPDDRISVNNPKCIMVGHTVEFKEDVDTYGPQGPIKAGSWGTVRVVTVNGLWVRVYCPNVPECRHPLVAAPFERVERVDGPPIQVLDEELTGRIFNSDK